MKITKRQLRRIIKEEKQNLIKEQWGSIPESGSPLVNFGEAWAGLGNAVREQMITLVQSFIENNAEGIYDLNPNAVNVAEQRLRSSLMTLGQSNPDGEELLEAIDWAKDIFEQGDAEVESDQRTVDEGQY